MYIYSYVEYLIFYCEHKLKRRNNHNTMNNMLNEKKNFIRHVLMNSPPGKLYDLVKGSNIIVFIEYVF
ncbi:hypothetical protein PFFVO_04664 [Plasmodium falciparum Vietnam Oak-Knoll (FVO)]|uniref:Uncharacterized protein n=1 Tax=Plasmodium falciparum Vietnam Oak-Knoll (FVO) TaxID=1036723 RepID=A0A024V1H5_PLAFA|nr:hypothetical protein PFFVO_04664 [Plasmodium falciparum Vietnam Oak-Knoll (FVO)]